jgi:hypothetical protein
MISPNSTSALARHPRPYANTRFEALRLGWLGARSERELREWWRRLRNADY